jgi:hypothetical protein
MLVYAASIVDYTQLEKWALDRSLPDDFLIKPALQHIKLAEEEGLEVCLLGPVHTLLQVYICLGDEANTLKYGRLFKTLTRVLKGKSLSREWYDDLKVYRKYPTWGSRKRAGKPQVPIPIPVQTPEEGPGAFVSISEQEHAKMLKAFDSGAGNAAAVEVVPVSGGGKGQLRTLQRPYDVPGV